LTINKNISVAVLPFEVFNQNQRLKTLIHGLTEDLITNLSKFVGLSVVSQFSTQQIKDLTNFDEIEKLGANFLVFGSIRNIADKLRITIQLIKSNDRSVIYSAQLLTLSGLVHV
jgi:TolB-like protein